MSPPQTFVVADLWRPPGRRRTVPPQMAPEGHILWRRSHRPEALVAEFVAEDVADGLNA
jgi:hypothetical protein